MPAAEPLLVFRRNEMGRMYVVSYGKSTDLGVKKRTLPRQITLGPAAIKFIAIVIFAALAVVYLGSSTSRANLSVQVRNLDNQQQDLQQKIDRLNNEGARLRALPNIDNQISSAQMQPAQTVSALPAK